VLCVHRCCRCCCDCAGVRVSSRCSCWMSGCCCPLLSLTTSKQLQRTHRPLLWRCLGYLRRQGFQQVSMVCMDSWRASVGCSAQSGVKVSHCSSCLCWHNLLDSAPCPQYAAARLVQVLLSVVMSGNPLWLAPAPAVCTRQLCICCGRSSAVISIAPVAVVKTQPA
jgi:hypothetical protein